MSTSVILLDQHSNANDVDIMEFEPCVLFPFINIQKLLSIIIASSTVNGLPWSLPAVNDASDAFTCSACS